MIDDYDKETSEERKKMIEPFLKEERRRLKTSLDSILSRADIILEKSNNPFNVLDRHEHSFINVLVKIRDASSYYLNHSKFEFIFTDFNFESRYRINFNETGMDLILSNWFSNVNKYKADDKYGVEVTEDDENYCLTFFNSFIRRNTKLIPDFVRDFNSSDRMAILKRNTHGLVEIKDFLEQMEIEGEMYNEDNVLFFKMSFKKNK